MSHRQRKSRRRNRHGARSKVLLGLGVIATVCVIAVLSLAGYVLAIASTAPDLSELKPVDKGQISVVYAADGSRLGFVQSDILRRVVPWSEMPVDLRRATVAIEDERFYKHKGVDLNAIVRAGIKNLESGETVQGGSTITQQLVRALYIKDPKRNFARKIREAKLASELEEEHSKTWILENYLNSVPYGTVERAHRHRRRGGGGHVLRQARQEPRPGRVGAAGRAYRRRPRSTTRSATRRRRSSGATRCSRRCSRTATSRRTEYEEAASQDLDLKQGRRYVQRREPYFFDYVQEQLIERYGVGRRAPRRPAHPHDDQPEDAGRRARRDQRLLRRPGRAELGDRVDRPGQRQDPGDGVERHLRRAPLQPRRPGPPPAGLGLQDVRADRGHPQGHRPRLHLLHVEAAEHRRPRPTASGRSRPSATATSATSA